MSLSHRSRSVLYHWQWPKQPIIQAAAVPTFFFPYHHHPLSRTASPHRQLHPTNPTRLPATSAERHTSRGAQPTRDDVSLADHTRSSAHQHAPPCHSQAVPPCPYRDFPNQGTRFTKSRSRR